MDNDVLMFAQVMAVLVSSVGALVAIGLAARILWRKGSRVQSHTVGTRDEGRLERLENAVDTIAIEVERISEAQRFTAGLLVERLPPRTGERVGDMAPPGTAKRVNTPH